MVYDRMSTHEYVTTVEERGQEFQRVQGEVCVKEGGEEMEKG